MAAGRKTGGRVAGVKNRPKVDPGADDDAHVSPIKRDALPPYALRRVSDLVPYARNARTHSPEQVAQIARSIQEFGFTNPVLIDGSDGIVAGHGRVMAALSLGMEHVPTIALAGLSDAQLAAYVIADNKLALNAGWDVDILRLELEHLRDAGFDLGVVGFSGDELDALFADMTEGETDPDMVPDAPAEPVSRPGDVWLLGRHRIVCGDCTDALVVEKALAGAKPHLMVTDPPYGVDYDPNWRNDKEQAGKGCRAPTGSAVGRVENDTRADWSEAWALFPGEVAYVWHAALHSAEVMRSLEACEFVARAQIIWAKTHIAISRGHYHWQHEPCWYVVRKGSVGHWAGDRKQTTLWSIDKPQKSETGHSTQKPVECMRRPIENNSKPGQAIYEPFSGSGTTIIACETTGRVCHAIEISPAYVDVAVLRWQAFTGQVATLEADGRAFGAASDA